MVVTSPDDDLSLNLTTYNGQFSGFKFSHTCKVMSFWTKSSSSDIIVTDWLNGSSSYTVINNVDSNSEYCYIYSKFPIYNGDETVNIGSMFNLSCRIEDKTVKCDISTSYQGNFRGYTQIYNRQTEQPSEASHISYKECDDKSGFNFDKNNPYHFEFKIQDYFEKCSDFNNFSKQVFIAISYGSKDNSDIYDEKYWALDLDKETIGDDKDDDLFSKKKDYPDSPNIEDFFDSDFPDIRDYVNFNMFDDADSIGDYIVAIFQFLWVCLTGFFKWLWACLRFIYFNFSSLFKYIGDVLAWLWECLKVALYNLCVDLRRLLSYLFLPTSEQFNNLSEKKFPALNKIVQACEEGFNSPATTITFNFLGNIIFKYRIY